MSLKENNKLKFKNEINKNSYEYNKDSNSSNTQFDDENMNSVILNNDSFEIDEKLYKEAEYISNALKNKTLDIGVDEETKLRQDLDLILSAGSKQKIIHNDDSKKEIIVPNGFNDNSNNKLSIDSSSNNVVDFSDGVSSDLSDVSSSDSVDNVVVDDFEEGVVEGSNDIFQDESIGSIDSNSISVDDALSDLVDDYSNDIVIKVNNVSMEYKVSKDKIDTLKEFVIRTIKRNKEKTKTISALNNISFEIHKGDRVGIIGFNGAGKSTLLKLLSRVYDPTEGTIETKGRIAPLLELGAGFDQNYTGKANIFLNGAFLGFSEDFIQEKYDEIVEFSELGDAINYHIKTYSSGMRAKLGFSIATIVEPDILIIDEILSVGDIKFQRKSSDKIRSMINSGITVLLVSHSVNQIRELCNKAIWIDNGEIKMMGEVNKVCDAYVKAANDASQEQLKNINLN